MGSHMWKCESWLPFLPLDLMLLVDTLHAKPASVSPESSPTLPRGSVLFTLTERRKEEDGREREREKRNGVMAETKDLQNWSLLGQQIHCLLQWDQFFNVCELLRPTKHTHCLSTSLSL